MNINMRCGSERTRDALFRNKETAGAHGVHNSSVLFGYSKAVFPAES